ncbi:hypothetical protein ACHHYP_13120 [Achlya hypogyna]|uniref:Uncharacterized protein n=1 Tax=Achlya hypogyna TaxID=1202772 RepID=A0A1V9YG22_ACHHY|nr:hypothetical protein ACHHYP_13120 [Achlya hypogyna]
MKNAACIGARDDYASPNKWKLPRLPSTELRCFSCGLVHGQPTLCDTYRYCAGCGKVMRESTDLPVPPTADLDRLHILAASFGHPIDPKLAVDITDEVRARVEVTGMSSRLLLSEDVSSWLRGHVPSLGVLKVVIIRYAVPNFNPDLTRRGEIVVREVTAGRLATAIHLTFTPDRLPKLWVLSGRFGHRVSTTRGLVFDVTERLTAWIDLHGRGCYLCWPSANALTDWLGDPCPGLSKALMVEYEIMGRSGQARQYEVDGHLKQDIVIQHLPIVAPAILIELAEYGWSAKDLQRKVVDLTAQIALGTSGLDPELAQFTALGNDARKDVTTPLQERIDRDGGRRLELRHSTNLNQLGGDPCPGLCKRLLIDYHYLGFGDSGNDNEVLKGGSLRNFALRRGGKLRLHVSAEGFLSEPIRLEPTQVFPSLQIVRAFFGHPTNALKTYDVTDLLAAKAQGGGGRPLVVPRTLDLCAEFGDPCRGIRKALTINYKVLGMAGRLVVPVDDDNHLAATLILGYPPETKDFGVAGKVSWAERVALTAVRTTKQTARDRMQSSASLRMWSNEQS